MTASLQGIGLDDSLVWTDEAASPLLAGPTRATVGGRRFTGTIVAQSRPMTLAGGVDGDVVWGVVPLSAARALAELVTVDVTSVMTLVWRGATWAVRWRVEEGAAPVSWAPVLDRKTPVEDSDPVLLTLRLWCP